jgi:hypothetical protein
VALNVFEPVLGGDAEAFHGRPPAFRFRERRLFLSDRFGSGF